MTCKENEHNYQNPVHIAIWGWQLTSCWKCRGVREINSTILIQDTFTAIIDTGHGVCTCGGFWAPIGGK